MTSMDAGALTVDQEGLAFLRDVLGVAEPAPVSWTAFEIPKPSAPVAPAELEINRPVRALILAEAA